jgi:UV DNA damage endonuclease
MYNLCCISNELKEQGYQFQTMTFKRWTQLCDELGDERALFELGDRWLNNCNVTFMAIQHCSENGWGYRVSSDLFPVLTHPDFKYDITDVPQYQEIVDCLRETAEYNQTWQVRLSTHPDQFLVLASENQDAVDKSIAELNHHGWVMDQLGCQRNHYNVMCLHVNCSKGDPADIAARFMSNLNRCDQSVQSRLAVETEDRGCWHAENLCEHFDIPVIWDNLHNQCNPSSLSELDAALLCKSTWNGIKPVFHLSESHPDKPNPRCHADMPTFVPLISSLVDADYDLEYKSKDAAIREIIRLSQDQTTFAERNKALDELTEQAQELDIGY